MQMIPHTPPRGSADVERGDVRMGTPPLHMGSRIQRPSFIPLPTSLGARASADLGSRPTGEASSLAPRTERSSSLSLNWPSNTTLRAPEYPSHARTESAASDGRTSALSLAAADGNESESGEAHELPVRVAVRLRSTESVEPSGRTVRVAGDPRTFTFDHVFADASQADVFAAVQPLLGRFVEGYNVTVLAYGQTSAGKTYTMGTGAAQDGEAAGVVPRALAWLFAWTQQQQGGTVDVRVSFVEVYNDELIDLVALTQHGGVGPPVLVRDDGRGGVRWVGVREAPVRSAAAALALLSAGAGVRQTGSTQMNEHSSRSHAIYTVSLMQTRAPDVQLASKLHFVDLAGSERLKRTQAEGSRKREGIKINSGLLALGNVISALAAEPGRALSHVPYRDSKLTHMLRDSLGGTALTMLVACVAGDASSIAESLNTLKYAARARRIRNCGGVNRVSAGSAEVLALRAQVRRLKEHVRALEQQLRGATLPADFPASRIPGAPAAVRGEAAAVRARNAALEAELARLGDTYTELLLKFTDTCRELEERQAESFARDRRLRASEHEIRKLTGHSRHSKRLGSTVTSLVGSPSVASPATPATPAVDAPGERPQPSAADFDAMMDAHDAHVRLLDTELSELRDALSAAHAQASRAEARAQFAERQHAAHAAQISSLREQLAVAHQQLAHEEQQRRAAEAELDDAVLAADARVEAAEEMGRREIALSDALWAERWDAAQDEHRRALASVARPVQGLMSPPSTANEDVRAPSPEHAPGLAVLEQDLRSSLREVDGLRRRVAEAEARAAEAQAARDEALALADHAVALKDEAEAARDEALAQRDDALALKDDAEARELAAVVRAAETEAHLAEARERELAADAKAQLAEAEAHLAEAPTAQPTLTHAATQTAQTTLTHTATQTDAPAAASDRIVLYARPTADPGASRAEQRLRSMRHRHSTALPIRSSPSPSPSASAADRHASYPELRRHPAEQPAEQPSELDRVRAEARELRQAKRELQERNSQMQNVLRELGDRLVALAEENDALELRAREHSRELQDRVADLEQQLAQRQQKEEDEQRPSSARSFHSANDGAASGLAQALAAAEEHRVLAMHHEQDAAHLRVRLAELSDELSASEHQASRALQQLTAADAARQHDADALAELRDTLAQMRESLGRSERRADEAAATADRYANELVRVQAEVRVALEDRERGAALLEDAGKKAEAEARDRDLWKARCLDMRDEIEELRARRRQSKIRCF